MPFRLASPVVLLAGLGVVTSPLAAAPLPHASPKAVVAPAASAWDGQEAEHYRGWRRYHPYRHGHGHRVDGRDILAGALIIGGIAAIVSAVNNDRAERARVERRVRRLPAETREPRGLDNAVAMCVDEIERDARVVNVGGVDRTGYGWDVRGTLAGGAPFICRIDATGRIADIDYGGSDLSSAGDRDEEYDDERDWRDGERDDQDTDDWDRDDRDGGDWDTSDQRSDGRDTGDWNDDRRDSNNRY
jgi:hypothetical protein